LLHPLHPLKHLDGEPTMTLDPRVGFWFSIVMAVIGVLAASSTQLTTIFGDHTSNIVMAVVIIVLSCGNVINGILHAIPSGNSPADAQKFALGPKVAATILLVCGLGFLLLSPDVAYAQQPKKTGSVASNIANFVTQLASFKDAAALSVQIPELQDN